MGKGKFLNLTQKFQKNDPISLLFSSSQGRNHSAEMCLLGGPGSGVSHRMKITDKQNLPLKLS